MSIIDVILIVGCYLFSAFNIDFRETILIIIIIIIIIIIYTFQDNNVFIMNANLPYVFYHFCFIVSELCNIL